MASQIDDTDGADIDVCEEGNTPSYYYTGETGEPQLQQVAVALYRDVLAASGRIDKGPRDDCHPRAAVVIRSGDVICGRDGGCVVHSCRRYECVCQRAGQGNISPRAHGQIADIPNEIGGTAGLGDDHAAYRAAGHPADRDAHRHAVAEDHILPCGRAAVGEGQGVCDRLTR